MAINKEFTESQSGIHCQLCVVGTGLVFAGMPVAHHIANSSNAVNDAVQTSENLKESIFKIGLRRIEAKHLLCLLEQLEKITTMLVNFVA